MRYLMFTRWSIFVLFLALILSGCGGGGDSDDLPSLQLSSTAVSFTLAAGASSSNKTVVITLPSGTYSLVSGYTTNQAQPSWVSYSISSFTISSSTADFIIRANPSGLASGTYTDRIYIEASSITGEVLARGSIKVTLTVTDPLVISTNRLDFQTADGASSVPAKTLSLSRVSTSGTWGAVVDQSWVILSDVNGSTPASLDVSVDITGLAIGSYSAALTITDNLTADTTVIPINLLVEPHRLSVIDNGVALSSLPSRSQLSHTIEIGENGGVATPWSAVSDQAWLTLSAPNGTTGDSLTLTADPTGLAVDAIHYADVTVTSADASIVNAETVKVGLFISSTDAIATTAFYGLSQPDYPTGLVPDPIRPYIYVSSLESGISVYNVYSGTLVTTIAGTANDTFGELDVSSDGGYLYAVNRFDNTINRVDLSTMTIDSTWSGFNFPADGTTPGHSLMDIHYVRLNGYPVLVTGGIQVLDAADGSVLTNMNDLNTYFKAPMIALSPEGKTAFVAYTGYVYFDLDRYHLWYSYISDSATAFLAQQKPRNTKEEAPPDMMVNKSGSALMTVQPFFPNDHFRTYANDENMTVTVREDYGQYTDLVAIAQGPTGKIYTVKRNPNSDDVIYFYDENFTPLSTTSVAAAAMRRKLVTSGDGMRLVLRTRNNGSDGIIMIDVAP